MLPRVSNVDLSPFGVELRKLRVEKRIRILELAQKIDVSASTVSAWETGRRQISQDHLTKLKDVLVLTPAQVKAIEEAARNSWSKIIIMPRSTEARELANSFRDKLNSLTSAQIRSMTRKYFRCSTVWGERVDFRVTPRTRNEIIKQAQLLRRGLGLQSSKPIDIVRVYDFALPLLFGGELDFYIAPDHEMEPGTVGISSIFPPSIKISNSKFEDAANGGGGGKWVLAHELGHVWLLHGIEYLQTNKAVLPERTLEPISPMRGSLRPATDFKDRIPSEESAEWQADEFAAELLMPRSKCRKLAPNKIVEQYNVSIDLAEKRVGFLGSRRRKNPYGMRSH